MKGKISSKLKKALAGVLAVVTSVAMLVPVGVTTFAYDAGNACKVVFADGKETDPTKIEFNSIQDAVDAIYLDADGFYDDAVAIVVTATGLTTDTSEAVAVDVEITLDAATSGYDLAVATPADGFCVPEATATTKTFAEHVPATGTWDWKVNHDGNHATATFTGICGNCGQPTGEEVIDVESTYDSDYITCTEGGFVSFEAETADGEFSSTYGPVLVPAPGHELSLSEESVKWSGKRTAEGVPVPTAVVYCNNCAFTHELSFDEGEIEFSNIEVVDPATCQEAGHSLYTLKFSYNGEYLKEVVEGVVVDIERELEYDAPPATGVHVKEQYQPPVDVLFLGGYDEAGEPILVDSIEDSAYAAGEADELTYFVGWNCQYCDAIFFEEGTAEVESVTYYLENGDKQTSKTPCSALAVTTFKTIRVPYEVEDGVEIKEFETGEVAVALEPAHQIITDGTEEYHVKAATCYSEGEIEGTCKLCGLSDVIEFTETVPHTFDPKDKGTKLAADCTHPGVTYKVCSVCEAAGIGEVTDVFNVGTTPLAGHVYGEDTPAILGSVINFGSLVPAEGHNFVVRNADDAEWKVTDPETGALLDDVTCVVQEFCTKCNIEPFSVKYHSAQNGEPTLGVDEEVFGGIHPTVTPGKTCKDHNVITFAVDGLKDLNSGKAVTADYETDVIGPHTWNPTGVAFTQDGTAALVSFVCANDPEETCKFLATVVESNPDENGLTTYKAVIDDEAIEAAVEVGAIQPIDIVNRDLKDNIKRVFNLDYAVATIDDVIWPFEDVTEFQEWLDSLSVTINGAPVPEEFYEVVDLYCINEETGEHEFPLPLPEDEGRPEVFLTIAATDRVDEEGISAAGETEAVFSVYRLVPVDEEDVTIDVTDAEFVETLEDEFGPYDVYEGLYDGEDKTLIVTSETEDAEISYFIRDEETGEYLPIEDPTCVDAGYYELAYQVVYPTTATLSTGYVDVEIDKAPVTVIQTTYTKVEGQPDPELIIDDTFVVEGDDLGLGFDTHAEEPGTYNVRFVWTNQNYAVTTNEYHEGTNRPIQYVTLIITPADAPHLPIVTVYLDDATTVEGVMPEFNIRAVDEAGVPVDPSALNLDITTVGGKALDQLEPGTYKLVVKTNNIGIDLVYGNDATLTVTAAEPGPGPDPEYTGWFFDGEHWFYYIEGQTVKSEWIQDDGFWYYLGQDGAMVTGWAKIGNVWYFLKGNGQMAENEWIDGWWLDGETGAWTYNARASWKQDAHGWWYGDTTGYYERSTTVMIDYVYRSFDAAGYWIP